MEIGQEDSSTQESHSSNLKRRYSFANCMAAGMLHSKAWLQLEGSSAPLGIGGFRVPAMIDAMPR